MRRRRGIALALALVAATGCSDGVGRGTTTAPPVATTPVATPSATPSSASPTPATPAQPVAGALAYATRTELRLRAADGAVRTLRAVPAGEVYTFAWSADGRHLAWLEDSAGRMTLHVEEPSTGRSGTWQYPDDVSAHRLGATADGFVLVDEFGPPQLILADPDEVVAGGEPRIVPLEVDEPGLLVATTRRLLVSSRVGVSGSGGGPETVYEVAVDGTATELFADGDGQPEGEVRNVAIGPVALTADGDRLVYAAGATPGGCDFSTHPVVRDLVRRREVDTAGAGLPGGPQVRVWALETGADGRTFAALATHSGECRDEQPRRAELFELTGTRWRKVAAGAVWGSSSARGELALISPTRVLTVGGKGVATGVRQAAWSPR